MFHLFSSTIVWNSSHHIRCCHREMVCYSSWRVRMSFKWKNGTSPSNNIRIDVYVLEFASHADREWWCNNCFVSMLVSWICIYSMRNLAQHQTLMFETLEANQLHCIHDMICSLFVVDSFLLPPHAWLDWYICLINTKSRVKRPAWLQQPNVYLEPKWLRYWSSVHVMPGAVHADIKCTNVSLVSHISCGSPTPHQPNYQFRYSLAG